MSYEERTKPTTIGDEIHRRAEAILGKRDYSRDEYLQALDAAQAEMPRGDVEELATTLLETTPELGSLEAARILAEVRLGVRREPADPLQATAERLA